MLDIIENTEAAVHVNFFLSFAEKTRNISEKYECENNWMMSAVLYMVITPFYL